MSKYLALFAKAIGMPKPIERSRYELEKHQSWLADNGGRQVGSTSEEPSEEEEGSTPESKKVTDKHLCDETCLEPKNHLSTYIRGNKWQP